MKPRNLLVRSLVVGAVLAGLFPLFGLLTGWLTGFPIAMGLYLAVAAAVYVAALAPSAHRAFGAFVLAGALGLATLMVTRDVDLLWVGAALTIAVVRSGFLHRPNRARALVVEGALFAGSLLFAAVLGASGHVLGIALALWGFFLAQSFHVVIADVKVASGRDENVDGFEAAQTRAMSVMEE